MQKERKSTESFEDYKIRLKNEKKQLRRYLKGRIFYNIDKKPYTKDTLA